MKYNNNKKSIIIVVGVLVVVLAVFAIIRGFNKKEEPKNTETKKETTDVVTNTTIEDTEDYYVATATEVATPVAKVEKKEQILTFTLNGDDIVYIDANDEYMEEGTFASDTVDGTITDNVIITIYKVTEENGEEVLTEVDEIDTTLAGSKYIIEYTITNSNNETKTLTRTVIINDIKEVILALIGDREIEVEAGDNYTDEGVTAVEIINGVSNDLNVTTKYYSYDTITAVETEISSIDTNVVGEYIIKYAVVSSDDIEYNTQRNITVVDTTSPVIEVENPVYIRMTDTSEELDLSTIYTVQDADTNTTVDITITDSSDAVIDAIDKNIVGEYTIEITATDSSNNTTTEVVILNVIDDSIAPVITASDVEYTVDENAADITLDSLYTVDDNTAVVTIKINGIEVDPNQTTISRNTADTYEVEITATDLVGNESTVTITVTVDDLTICC